MDQELLDKYPDSLLSECLENSTTNEENECTNIDRDGGYFAKILSFMRDKNSLTFRRMSKIDLDILKNEAFYYNIEELVVASDNYEPMSFG